MNKKLRFWISILIYLILIFLPLIVMLIFPMPRSRELWRDLSVIMGFMGLSLAGLQFIPTARIKVLSDVFDLDQVYSWHHYTSILSVLLVFLHPVLLVLFNPNTLLLLNPISAPWRAQAGLIGLVALILIAITSVLRKELKIRYNTWHLIHDILAVGIAVFALIHIYKVDYYTSAPAMIVAWIVEVVIWLGITIYVRVIKPIQMIQKPYEVKEIVKETADTFSLVLKPVGHPGHAFNATQVAWININTSPFTLNRNPFSISCGSKKEGDLCFTIKDLGDFTSTIGKLKGGEKVYVDGPHGNFSFDFPGMKNGMVLLAGGIGVAPIMSILRTFDQEKDARPLYFFYGNFDDKNIIFNDELKKLEKSLKLKIVHVLEKPSKKMKTDVGFISKEIMERELPKNYKDLHYFICGPLPMIDAMERQLAALEIPKKHISSEKYDMA